MRTPRTVKAAFNNGYIIQNIRDGHPDVRIMMKKRFVNHDDRPLHLYFWYNKKVFKRNYPHAFERFWLIG